MCRKSQGESKYGMWIFHDKKHVFATGGNMKNPPFLEAQEAKGHTKFEKSEKINFFDFFMFF